MGKVVLYLIVIWVIVALLILGITLVSPAMNDIAETSANVMASGNMTGIVGVEDAVRSYAVWKWFLPIFIGVVLSAIVLYKNRDEVFRR
jgi:preprotein translocase subunit SecG